MSQHWAEAFIGKTEQEDRERGKARRESGNVGRKRGINSKKQLAEKRQLRILERREELIVKHPNWKNSDIANQIHKESQKSEREIRKEYPDIKKTKLGNELIKKGYVNLATNTIQKKLPPLKRN